VLQLLEDVNDYWESPMPEERMEKLRDQGRRLILKGNRHDSTRIQK
jgi:hypothetical protein